MEKIAIGDVYRFEQKEGLDTISGIVTAIEDASWHKVLNGDDCLIKQINGQLTEEDFILEKMVKKDVIVTVYGWCKSKKSETFGTISFSITHYNEFKI